MLYIDMAMPKVCADCPCMHKVQGDGEYTHDYEACGILNITLREYVYYGKELINPYKERLPNCPLKEVIF